MPVAVRGNIKRANAGIRQFIEAPKGIYSEKPAEARESLVTLMGNIPRIELFAGTKTPGWRVWGRVVESAIVIPSRVKQLAHL